MTLDSFKAIKVATRLGPVRLWLTPEAGAVRRPLVFAMPGVLAADGDFEAMLQNLGLLADGCLMRPPRDLDASLAELSLAALSAAVGEIVETAFAGRRIVLVGASTGALVALGVRAANVARVVAIEPPLASAELWPVLEPLGAHMRKVTDPVSRAFVDAAFGVRPDGVSPRDHLALLDGLTAPVEVILGGNLLQPRRELPRYPSLVGEAERRRLSETPGVRLQVIPETGHNVLGQALEKVTGAVKEACRRAGADLGPARLRLDEPLLGAVPLTARSLLYCGQDGAVFAEALARINPKAAIMVAPEAAAAGPAGGGGYEAIVLAHPVPAPALARLTGLLRPGGHLIARWRAPDAELKAELADAGLALREPADSGGTGVVRAQKLGPAPAGRLAEPRPALVLQTVAFASLLMDIRTRLPAQGLAADPELRVIYDLPPTTLPPLRRDAPKVVVLQRPLEGSLETWRPMIAACIRDGWVTVLEYDDYPPLISEVKGRPVDPQAMRMFGYVHAVQTASPPLVELFRPFNPEVAHFPNAVFDLAPFPAQPRGRKVFYGAVIRGRYAVEVARSLGPALEGLDDVEFTVIGDREVFDALPGTAKRYYEYMSFEAYLELMSQCSISLSPIEALPFRETKSDAKFLDASRAGLLTIASPTIYDRVIEHEVNGFLARDAADWPPLLRRALTDEPMRERMARAAWTYVRDERMFAEQAVQRRDWYYDLWARREALSEAAMARTPGLREAVAAGR